MAGGLFIMRSIASPPVLKKRQTSTAASTRKAMLSHGRVVPFDGGLNHAPRCAAAGTRPRRASKIRSTIQARQPPIDA